MANAQDDGQGSTDGAQPVQRIVVVGGGTAGWLSACLIAARADRGAAHPIAVTLIEAPGIPPVGVGEGTWPTMRGTLAAIGLDEPDFMRASHAAFKQGTRFDGWVTGAAGDRYYHPFTGAPGDIHDLIDAWRASPGDTTFADAATPQPAICARDLSPRQQTMPAYAGALNYAYHFDACRFGAMLARHGQDVLGVTVVRGEVGEIEMNGNGHIAAVHTDAAGRIAGDLFLDCTGRAARLIDGQMGVPFIDRSDILFNDRAIATQVPHDGGPIASETRATAHAAGWIWDIGLPARRGVGCVYASTFMDDDAAEAALRAYVARTGGGQDLAIRRFPFASGHRERFWVGNCLAVGLAAGFLEPLEASAIVLIELSVAALLADFPPTRAAMAPRAAAFNRTFRYRWDRIVEFLKLHYLLSRRDEPYWRAHRVPDTVPPRLAELMALWADRPPLPHDFDAVDEVFPAASWQYVLYGMNTPPPPPGPIGRGTPGGPARLIGQRDRQLRSLVSALPSNDAYIRSIAGMAHPSRSSAAP